jgi:hypothetical protein
LKGRGKYRELDKEIEGGRGRYRGKGKKRGGYEEGLGRGK